MKNKYLIRLDDACPTMDKKKWLRMFDLLDCYAVRPLVGIIPHNEDTKQQICPEDSEFWNNAREWEKKGYAIALHGYNHCYISKCAGINPLWNRSEFAGVEYSLQAEKIKKGYSILKNNGLHPKYFFAPSHTFDENTLKALLEYTDIHIISDTIATKPYQQEGGLIFIPQIGGHCVDIKIKGIWTFCLHPSMMSEADFEETEQFLKKHKDDFVAFDELNLSDLNNKDFFSRILSWLYFTLRKIRGIR